MTNSCKYSYKDALKKYKPQQFKYMQNELTLPVPGRLIMTLSAPKLVQAADITLRGKTTLDWKREFISNP